MASDWLDSGLRNRAALKRRDEIMDGIADRLGLDEIADLHRLLSERLDDMRINGCTENERWELDQVVDQLNRIEALDHPWVFGQRYMRHHFVSEDPTCTQCESTIPHRTLLMCPTCGSPGPWKVSERVVPSSFAHYLIVDQVARLFKNELLMPDGEHYADGSVTAMPRGGAKSTWLLLIVALWSILTERSRCCLVLSNTIAQVTERSMEIKTELEDNAKIIEEFGHQAASKQERRVWTQTDFVLANGGRVVARGTMQSMRGVKNKHWRPDAVLGDDADDEKYLTSVERAQQLLDWWDKRVVPACHPNSVYMVHGTILGEMALLHQMHIGHRGGSFIRRKIRAVEDRPGCMICGMPRRDVERAHCPVCDKVTKANRPSSFWGSRFSVEALGAIKRRIGHWAWQSEFQQEPHDDSTSWFEKEWLDRCFDESFGPPPPSARIIIPWSIIACTLTGREMVSVARHVDSNYGMYPGQLGPYQLILQTWDPAWARVKNPVEAKGCWMAGAGMGLTWDDRVDVFWLDRGRGLVTSEYRKWMYESWRDDVMPASSVEVPGQLQMIVEKNGGGVLFAYGIEEHWGSVPLTHHQTGTDKHDLRNGIPGMASWFKDGRFIIRAGGTDKQRELATELKYELQGGGKTRYTDMLMTLWFGWAYIRKWMDLIRDPARYDELSRRSLAGDIARGGTH